MPQISYIHYHDILEAYRFDADFFIPEYLEMEKYLQKWYGLSQITKTVDLQSNWAFADIFKILNDNNEKIIPYIRSTNVGNFFLNRNDLEFISQQAHNQLPKTQTKYLDVIMARKGKIWWATLILSDDAWLNTNDNIVNIRIIDTRFNSFYLTTFLNSKYGLLQVKRFATGNVQPRLSMYQVRILKIPLLNDAIQHQIETLVKSAHEKQAHSANLYTEAENLLLAELGLLDYQTPHQLTFTTTKSAINQSQRYDAEYF